MKTIIKRYEELTNGKSHILTDDVLETLETINMEYFNNTLDIEIVDSERFGFLIQINGVIYNDRNSSLDDDLKYLQDMYETYTIKRKIEKINENY